MAFLRFFPKDFLKVNPYFFRSFASQNMNDQIFSEDFSFDKNSKIKLSDIILISKKILANDLKISELEGNLRYCKASMFKNITDKEASLLLRVINDNFNPGHGYLVKGLGYIQEGVGINLYKYLETNSQLDNILFNLVELQKKSFNRLTINHKLNGALIGYIMVVEKPLVKAKQIYEATRIIKNPESLKKYKIAYERMAAKIDPIEFSKGEKRNIDYILKSFALAQETCKDIKFEIINKKS